MDCADVEMSLAFSAAAVFPGNTACSHKDTNAAARDISNEAIHGLMPCSVWWHAACMQKSPAAPREAGAASACATCSAALKAGKPTAAARSAIMQWPNIMNVDSLAAPWRYCSDNAESEALFVVRRPAAFSALCLRFQHSCNCCALENTKFESIQRF